MRQILGRFHRNAQKAADSRKIANILIEVGEPAPEITIIGTAPGDERKLRGIPAIGRGVAGAIPGTAPHNVDVT